MNLLFAAGIEMQNFCRRQGWQFCITGGLAVARWGEHQTTTDVNFSILCHLGAENSRIQPLLRQFSSRIDDPVESAQSNRALLLTASNGTQIDISLAGFPYEEAIISRASLFRFAPSVVLTTCSAEDLIVLKVIAGRAQDWVDIAGVLTRQKKLDVSQIEAHLANITEFMPGADLVEAFRSRRS